MKTFYTIFITFFFIMILGTGSTTTHLETLSCACPKCHTLDSIVAYIEQGYFTILFIPFCPLRRSGYAICTSCNTIFLPRKMPVHMRKLFSETKKQGSVEWWMFIGITLFIGLFCIGWIHDLKNQHLYRDWIAYPEKGDIYTIYLDHEYTNMMYATSSSGSLLFYPGTYVSHKKSQLKMMELSQVDAEFATGKTIEYRQSVLIDMLDSSTLVEIRRPSLQDPK